MSFTPTPDQRRAIESPPGPVLVVAGPGAGKTYCLIGRVHHLITVLDYPPERVCAVTFTNRAAGEIAARLTREIGAYGGQVTRGTLHSLCLQVLRANAEAAGLRQGFGVADEEYQQALLRKLRVREEAAPAILTAFGRARLQGQPLPPEQETLFQAYRTALRRRNLVDFDDLILYTNELLQSHAAVLGQTAGQWDALLVDEFQDLSPLQYAILRRLAERHRHLFAVGDDEQSIYGWAGADPRILETFRRDFDVTPIVLETNHRNSVAIFEAARQVLRVNARLFDKRLVAARAGTFPVRAVEFPSDREELGWLIEDLGADRAAHGLRWEDYALLYRTHRLGQRLEGELLKAGIPVRTAQGRAVADDPIAGPVLAAFRLLQHPTDTVPMEMLSRRFLEPETRELLRAQFGDKPFRTALRLFGRDTRMPELERKRANRLCFHIENIPALARTSATVGEFVAALLEQRPGDKRTQLEERADELTDPAELPAARDLAEALTRVWSGGHRVHLVPLGGLDIALRGMLRAAGFGAFLAGPEQGRAADDLVLDLPGTPGMALRLFKALQLLAATETGLRVEDCVTFDLETTGTDVEACGIVELGAARVRGGWVVETFQALINPGMPIPPESTKVHRYTDTDVAGAPSFADVWPRFREFVGNDLLVAHNGRRFDLPVLARHIRDSGGDANGLTVFDTLPLAKALVRESGRLVDLARKFGIPHEEAHHALDDAITLAGVLSSLNRLRQGFHRRTAFAGGLDWLGLALVLEPGDRTPEETVLLDMARAYTLGRYSDCLERYELDGAGRADAPAMETVIERLGGRQVMQRIRARKTPADRYPTSVERLRRLLEGLEQLPVGQGIAQVLDMVALSRREGLGEDPGAVSLLTLHATKGLEFSRVYILGVEDHQLPGRKVIEHRLDDEYPEARRLLYVGMTRARDRLIMTRAQQREGKSTGGTMFLEEMGVQLEPVVRMARDE